MTLQHLPRTIHVLVLLTGLGHTEFSVQLGEVHGWRCRARLALRGRPGRPVSCVIFVGGVRQVVLVWNATAARAEQDPKLRALADALWLRHGPESPAPLLHSVWANAQPGRSNTIFGADWLQLRRLPAAKDPFTWQVLP